MWGLAKFWDDLKGLCWKCWSDDGQTRRQNLHFYRLHLSGRRGPVKTKVLYWKRVNLCWIGQRTGWKKHFSFCDFQKNQAESVHFPTIHTLPPKLTDLQLWQSNRGLIHWYQEHHKNSWIPQCTRIGYEGFNPYFAIPGFWKRLLLHPTDLSENAKICCRPVRAPHII